MEAIALQDEFNGIALVPLVIGAVEVAKQVGLPTRFAPLISLVLGLGAGFFLHGESLAQAVVSGLMIGLSASGLYSATKTVVGK